MHLLHEEHSIGIFFQSIINSNLPPMARYHSVDIVAMGRTNSCQPSLCTQSIAVDLAYPSQVVAAASLLASKWYCVSDSSPLQHAPGIDIIINNAGIFTGRDAGDI
jgi:hypothetical protein